MPGPVAWEGCSLLGFLSRFWWGDTVRITDWGTGEERELLRSRGSGLCRPEWLGDELTSCSISSSARWSDAFRMGRLCLT